MMTTMMDTKSYNEMLKFDSFDERVEYLKLYSMVGEDTFGYMRYLNQQFYRTRRWRRTRDLVIIRDLGCDLGDEDYPISSMVLVHHINPITIDDILNDHPKLYDLNNLVSTSKETHDYIHYGKIRKQTTIANRSKNDQAPWLS